MNWAGAFLGMVRKNDADVLLGLSALVLILLVSVIRLQFKVGKLSRRKPVVQTLPDAGVLESLDQGLAEIRNNSQQLAVLTEDHGSLAARQEYCIQKCGIVKFNAFDDMGGEQSFALALLDANNNGVLLSSLLSRTESRTYAKPIAAGRSEQVLSEEEQQALSRAMKT